MRAFFHKGSYGAPHKEGEQIPQGEFGIEKVKPGLLVQDKNIEKVVDKFVHNIRNEKFLKNHGELKLTFGKITGDKDKRRHVEGNDEPLEGVQKRIVPVARLDEMPHDDKHDQKNFVVVE